VLMRKRFIVVGFLTPIVIAAAITAWVVNVGGFSTRAQPTWAERVTARSVRQWAVPPRMRHATNPVAFSTDVWAESREHFADHCATCHANDGSGDTAIGRNLYPKVPDMRLAETQRLTEGELYWIIENGVRLTGMPAWGSGGDNDTDTWKLVHFIRHLNDLTPTQIDDMKALNPKSTAELEEERQDQDFLDGKSPETSPQPPSHHQHKE
jgi:mono/diheme cytochrome c family protein